MVRGCGGGRIFATSSFFQAWPEVSTQAAEVVSVPFQPYAPGLARAGAVFDRGCRAGPSVPQSSFCVRLGSSPRLSTL